MQQPSTTHPIFGNVISFYTRADALADGVLIDAGAMAREAGFHWPVALTAAAYADCVEWSEDDSKRQVPQDLSGRLWDVLFMAAYAAKANPDACSELKFELYRVPRDGPTRKAELTTLKLMIGPGDGGAPVMTILLPNED